MNDDSVGFILFIFKAFKVLNALIKAFKKELILN